MNKKSESKKNTTKKQQKENPVNEKNRQGFTLVELLVTVLVVALVVSLVIATISNTTKSAEDKTITINKNSVLEASSLYADEFEKELVWRSNEEETMACIDIKQLVDQGYLKASEVGKEYDTYAIKVTKTDKLVNEYQLMKTSECKLKDTKVPVITLKDETVEIKTNYDIKTNVVFDGTGSDIMREVITLNNKAITNTKDLDLGSYDIYYEIEDEGGNVAKAMRTIKIVDTIKPNINSFVQNPSTSVSSWVNKDVSVSVNATDNGSGIVAYQFSQKSSPENNKWNNVSNKPSSITQKINATARGKWYFHVKDRAGNVSSQSVDVYVDKINPSHVSTNGSMGNNSVPDATFKDDESGLKEVKYYISTSSTKPEKTNTSFSTNKSVSMSCGTSYYGWAIGVDKVGNISDVVSLSSYYRSCSSGGSSHHSSSGGGGGSSSSSSSSSGSSCSTTCQMQKNSEAWHQASSQAEKDALHRENERLAKQYEKETGKSASYDDNKGSWSDSTTGKNLYNIGSGSKSKP